MAVSKSQQKAVHKYVKANYDRMELTVPKGQKDTIKAHASTHGESVNGFIGRAISETMERDSGTTPEIAGNAAETAQGAGAVSLPSETLKASQETAGAGMQPIAVDKATAAEKLLDILGDLDTVDLDKDKCERLGIMYLPPDTLEAAQRAAERTGETVPAFVARAVAAQEKRDTNSFKLGINPA